MVGLFRAIFVLSEGVAHTKTSPDRNTILIQCVVV